VNPRVAVVACLAAVLLAGCGDLTKPLMPKKPAIEFSSNVTDQQADVPVDTIVEASATHGDIATIELEWSKGSVPLKKQGRAWMATERLEPGTKYHLTATGTGEDGKSGTLERSFTTQALALSEQTYPSVSPLAGETVGVGMPVIVRFDLPVKNKELFEKNMLVETSTPIEGRWAWFSDTSVHFRPKEYWPADTEVTIKLMLNSLPAGSGIYGQQDQVVKFRIGQKMVAYVDVNTHQLTVKADDEVIRTIPVSTGDAKHQTRNGTKIIMEKLTKVDMDAATTGVDSEDPGYYDIEDVKWAMRLTFSGEFLHAAPWSVASQGRANVSHGCTGMSTENAGWLFGQMKKGDPVEYTGSPRQMEPGNGWTDWNVPWDEWVTKSALKEVPTASPTPSPSASASASGSPAPAPSASAPATSSALSVPNPG